MKKITAKFLCVSLVLSLVFLTACSGKSTSTTTSSTAAASSDETAVKEAQATYTDKASSVKKTETVYVNANYYGAQQNIIVSDWLHTDKEKVQVSDVSDLANIANAKDDIAPVINGTKLTWNMPTTDLYYRGISTKALPVTIGVKYYLNDQQVAVEDLAGKSGKVKIVLDFKNNIFTTKKINGKLVTVYNPVLVVGGMILPESQFSNITVSDGKAIGDGSKEIAVVASTPGVYDTLGLANYKLKSKEMKFPTEFTITADVKDFTLGNMYFAVLPYSALSSTVDLTSNVGSLESSLSKISSVMNSVYSLNPDKLIKMLKDNKNGLTDLTDALTQGAKLYEENKALLAVLKKYMTPDNVTKLQKLVTDLNNTDLQKYSSLLNNPLLQSFFKDLPTLSADLQDVMPIWESMNKDLSDPTVKKSVDNLPTTLKQLSAILNTLDKNEDLVNALLEYSSPQNMNKITDIVKAVESANLTSILSDYSKLADNTQDILDRFEAMANYGNSYNIYSAATDDMETSTMFVYQTPSITKSTSKEKTTDEAGLSSSNTEKKGVFERIKGWFTKK